MARMLLDDWLEALDGQEGLLSPYSVPAPAPAPEPYSAPLAAAPAAAPAPAEPAGQWVRMPSGGEGWEDVFVPARAPAPVAQANTETLGNAPFDWAKYGYTGGNPVVMADVQSGGEGPAFTSPVAGVTPEFSKWLDSQGLQVKNYGDDSGAVGVWDLSKNGQLVDRQVDQISSTDQLLNQLAPAIIAAVAAPGLGQALFGGGLLGSAGAGAVLGGLRAAGEGDNILEGAAKGGASGALGNLVSSAFAGGNALTSPMDASAVLQEGIPDLLSQPPVMPSLPDLGALPVSSLESVAPQLAISPVDAGAVLSQGLLQEVLPQVPVMPSLPELPTITPSVITQGNPEQFAVATPVAEPVITPEVVQQLMPDAPPEVVQQIVEQLAAEPVAAPVATPVATPVAEPDSIYSLATPKPPGLTLPALGPGYDLAPAPVFDNGSGLLGSPDTLSSLTAPISTYIPPADYTLSTPSSGLQPTAVPSNIGITAPAAGGGTLTQFGVIPDTATPMLGSGGLLNSGAPAAQTAASNAGTTPDPYANETAKLVRQQELAQSGTQGGGLGNMSGSAAVLPSQIVNMTPLEEAMQSLKNYTGGFSDWVKENPMLARLIFTGGGALLSTIGGGGGGGGGSGYKYNGPMPVIKRGGSYAPTPKYLTPRPDSLLSVPKGNSNDGLLRFLGG